ncbi:hypothetical protein ACFLXB_08935 [Chloroflexota bacterium]
MIITKETLLRIANDTVVKRTEGENDGADILTIYLTGSLLREDPLMGNSTDIDMVFIHSKPPIIGREIVRLNTDVHLDIKHSPREEYEPARELRNHPWMGPAIYNAVQLYDPEHFFDFVQAAVRDRYHDPFNAHARASLNAAHARSIWEDLTAEAESKTKFHPKSFLRYLKTINHAANSLTVIKDRILGERRFLVDFPAVAESYDLPELGGELYSMMGAGLLQQNRLEDLLAAWEKDFLKAGMDNAADARLHPTRMIYYQRGFETLISEGRMGAILWPLLHTWSLAASTFPKAEQSAWEDTCQSLGMLSEGMTSNLIRLDAFLDKVEILLEEWKNRYGLSDAMKGEI